jgi:hypothetical protein
MRILACCFVYNEIKYIDQWVNWYRSQGCELFVLDNISNDGTYEWLQGNGVECERFNTNGAFHLHILQQELNKHIARIKPDWVCYTGADLFIITDKTLRETIEHYDAIGVTQIKLPCYNAVNTGETFALPLQKYFIRGGLYRDLSLICKFSDGFTVVNDNAGSANNITEKANGIIINYGGCKPAREQEEKLRRRKKAWDEGLPSNLGKHFRKGSKRNWTYSVDTTINLMESEAGQYIKKIL